MKHHEILIFCSVHETTNYVGKRKMSCILWPAHLRNIRIFLKLNIMDDTKTQVISYQGVVFDI
jgi:hypothetical protein